MSIEIPRFDSGEGNTSLTERERELAAKAAKRLRVAAEEANVQVQFAGTVTDEVSYDFEFFSDIVRAPEDIERQHDMLMEAASGTTTEDIRDREPLTRFFFMIKPYSIGGQIWMADHIVRRVTRLNDFVAVVEDTYIPNWENEPTRYDARALVSATPIEEMSGQEVPSPL